MNQLHQSETTRRAYSPALVRQPQKEWLCLPPLWGAVANLNTQRGFILNGKRFSICAAGTKSGKTQGCAIWLAAMAWQRKGLYGWFAPSYKQVMLGFNAIKDLLPESMRQVNESDLTIKLPIGSVIEFRTGEKPNLLYGPSYIAAVVDEASRIRQEAWTAIQTTLTTFRAPAKIIANAMGKRNWFFRWYQRAENGEPGLSCHKIKTKQNPFIPRAAIADAKRNLPPQKFRELYQAEFFDDLASMFPAWSKAVNKSIVIGKPQVGHVYGAGLDLANARDFLALTIGCFCCGRIVYFEQWNHMNWPASIERTRQAVQAFGSVEVFADATSMGGQVIVDYLKLGDGKKIPGLRVTGITFTNDAKETMVNQLQLSTQRNQIEHPGFPIIDQQLAMLEGTRLPSGKWRYAAPDDDEAHDDAAWSTMLWNSGRLFRTESSHAGLLKHQKKQVDDAKKRAEENGKDQNGKAGKTNQPSIIVHQSGAIRR